MGLVPIIFCDFKMNLFFPTHNISFSWKKRQVVDRSRAKKIDVCICVTNIEISLFHAKEINHF